MRKAYFQMHLAILLWGFTGILGKAIEMSEGMIVWYRMIISAIGLLPLLYYRKAIIPDRKSLYGLLIAGVIVALHWVFFYASIKASNVSIALSCFSSIALFTALLESVSKRQLPKLPEILLSIAVIGGLYLIFSFRQMYVAGILMAIFSAFLGAVFTILNKRLTETHSATVITFYELITGFLVLTLLLPVYFAVTDTGFEVPGGTDLFYLLLLGFICTSFAFTISLKALKKLDPFTLNLSVNLEPLYSIVLAFWLFGEMEIKSSGFMAGTIIIIGSVVIHTWYTWKIRRSGKVTGMTSK
jgi:drug/metabolite transporter (DMT)-like permease